MTNPAMPNIPKPGIAKNSINRRAKPEKIINKSVAEANFVK